ncbi:MAG TPA: ferritin-like domain-containing protein [Gaiellaceae bacterium]|nr:ferritin-like domain-containing protein [Gaiellaceae bacterium]
MSDHLPRLEELDRDGAIQEAAAKVDGSTRAAFLRKAGVGVGVVMGGGAFAGVLPSLARGATLPAGDVDILNFALTLEYLEAAFYAEAKGTGALTDKDTIRFAHVVSQHEADHVAFLKKALGSKAVAQPKFDFKGTTHDQAKFQATADALEATGVHAYLGQAGNIKTKAILLAAAKILPVEARHHAWIRDIRFAGGTTSASTPAPAPFENGASKAVILGRVKATGFIQP